MNDLIVGFQNSIIEMLQNNRLTQEEFDILASLSDGMDDKTVLDLVEKLKMEDLKDRDIIDCITNKHFRTALVIISDGFIQREMSEEVNKMFGA